MLFSHEFRTMGLVLPSETPQLRPLPLSLVGVLPPALHQGGVYSLSLWTRGLWTQAEGAEEGGMRCGEGHR